MKRKIINSIITLTIIAVAIMVSAFMIKNKPEPKRDLSKQEVLYVKTSPAPVRFIPKLFIGVGWPPWEMWYYRPKFQERFSLAMYL